MSLKATGLLPVAAPLPATFVGTPQDLFAAMIERLKIMSPNGVNFIFIGDVQPSTNVGPWLRNGTQWWVWSNTQGTYIPQDISASLTVPFFIGNSIPTGTNPPVWLETTQNATDQNPNNFGTPIGWNFWNGSAWVPFNSLVNQGNTASRPANPAQFQQYYDTDISVLIWWERGAWRTVSGVPGDLKFVATPNLNDALTQNPGWDYFGRSNTDLRGRIPCPASVDPGSTPPNSFPTDNGVTPQVSQTRFGESTLLQLQPSSQTSLPPQIALWLLIKT